MDDDTSYKIRIRSRFGQPVKPQNSGPWKTTSGTTASAPSEDGNTSDDSTTDDGTTVVPQEQPEPTRPQSAEQSEDGNTSDDGTTDDRTTVVPQEQPEPTSPQSAEQSEDPYLPTEVRNLRAVSPSDHDTLVLNFDRPSHVDWDTGSGDLGYRLKLREGETHRITYTEVLPTDSLKWPSDQNTHNYTFDDLNPELDYVVWIRATRYVGTGDERELVRGFPTVGFIYYPPEDSSIEEPAPNPPLLPSVRLQNAPTDSDPDKHFDCSERKNSIGNLCYATYHVSLPDVLAWMSRNGKDSDDYEYFYTVRNVYTNQNMATTYFEKALPNGEIWLPPGYYHVRIGFKTKSSASESFTSSISIVKSVFVAPPRSTPKGHAPPVAVTNITTKRTGEHMIEVSWTKPAAAVSSSASTAGWEITSYRVGNVGSISGPGRNNSGPKCGDSNFGKRVGVSYRDYGKTRFTTRIYGGWHTARVAVQPHNPRGGGECASVLLPPPEVNISVFSIREDIPDHAPGTHRPLRSSVWDCEHTDESNVCAREYVVNNYELEGWARAVGDSSLAQIKYSARSDNGSVLFEPSQAAYDLPATISVPPGTWDLTITPVVSNVEGTENFTPADVTVGLPNYADFGYAPSTPTSLRSSTLVDSTKILLAWHERVLSQFHGNRAGNGGWPVTEFRIYNLTGTGSGCNENYLIATVAGGYDFPYGGVINRQEYEAVVPYSAGNSYAISAVNLRGEGPCAFIQP